VKKQEMELIKNLLYFYFLVNRTVNPWLVYQKWYKDSILADYTRPEYPQIKNWFVEFSQEVK
jgi:hypothetical protein